MTRRPPERPSSVVYSDQEALRSLLVVHAVEAPRILDVTHNRGRFWRGLPYAPHRSDVDPALLQDGYTDTVADFRQLPAEWSGSWDVVVFDPPHTTEPGKSRRGIVAGAWAGTYGSQSIPECRDNIVPLFRPFLVEAQRVLVPGGIVIAKIADQVHRGRQQWQGRAFQNVAEEVGFTCCDQVIKVRKSVMQDPKNTSVHHVRKQHCYWIVLRNGEKCVGRRGKP